MTYNITYTSFGQIVYTNTQGLTSIYNPGDISWILTSTALVMLMTPGLGIFYAGLLRRKNALSLMFLSMAVYCVVAVQWFVWGYSLVYSPNPSPFIGSLSHLGFRGTGFDPAESNARIPQLAYAIYQMMFATITSVIMIGAAAERGRIVPALLFAFVWATIVYAPIARWTWCIRGWSLRLGSLDFGGGGPVHMASGSAALAYSLILGKRAGYGTARLVYRSHNTSHVIIGTALLWFGWFGFIGGSTDASNLQALHACLVLNLSAAAGGLSWLLIDRLRQGVWSPVSFCSGVLVALIAATPSAGLVPAPAGLAFGVISAIVCNYATAIKVWLECDDSLDIFASHAIGGLVGSLLTGIFASAHAASSDGRTIIRGGWVDGHFIQFGYQLASSCAILSYSFGVSLVILWALDRIPGIGPLRVSEEAEIEGVDYDQLGDFAYDFVEQERELVYRLPRSPLKSIPPSPTTLAPPIRPSMSERTVSESIHRAPCIQHS
ncbi:hypothetical protein CROQUDRAFT_655897 [Cronartium quercuum f. sp. fusiforme G11]|uniref:Ammonium transporter n=1 Tax=Cronartium quercuum f. sp. fusiforme G11 TaxID=708437 RepID=A0A9P6NIP6_9BASI|nr:hypothetical protein CROQUDRAFT_655897 [Cronartium quercuum f. sp. fusiforme G11]